MPAAWVVSPKSHSFYSGPLACLANDCYTKLLFMQLHHLYSFRYRLYQPYYAGTKNRCTSSIKALISCVHATEELETGGKWKRRGRLSISKGTSDRKNWIVEEKHERWRVLHYSCNSTTYTISATDIISTTTWAQKLNAHQTSKLSSPVCMQQKNWKRVKMEEKRETEYIHRD